MRLETKQEKRKHGVYFAGLRQPKTVKQWTIYADIDLVGTIIRMSHLYIFKLDQATFRHKLLFTNI